MATEPRFRVAPLTPARWPDLQQVFAAKGCSQARWCWCMYYRRSGGSEPPERAAQAEANQAALKALVDAGQFTGLLGYRGEAPVAWLSFGPRGDYPKLARSPVLKPVDAQPVWSLICFVIPADYRGQGLAHAMLKAAVQYARQAGATLVEAYPVDKAGRSADDSLWFGSASMYARAGFSEVARRKPQRPILRLQLSKP